MSLPFQLAAFLAAFLLFEGELIVAKAVLPWFGGAPMVWTTCMLVFQALLLLGYLHAHLLVSRASPRTQAVLHLVWVWGSIAFLATFAALSLRQHSPFLPGSSWRPDAEGNPTGALILLLVAHVGFPFLVLAATSPLLQAWAARVYEPGLQRSPYTLYAVSNLGSLLGLLAYPFLVEPRLALDDQAAFWTAAYVVFAITATICAAILWRSGSKRVDAARESAESASEAKPTFRLQLAWILLAAIASTVLLASTNHLSQVIASVPFLWVLPLAVYLGTFIACFRGGRPRVQGVWTFVLLVAAILVAVSLSVGPTLGIAAEVGIPIVALLASAMVCHGALARSKPAPCHLTGFYVALALGGTVGGVFVSLAAPLAFEGFAEYPLGIWLACLAAATVAARDRDSWVYRSRPSLPFAALAAVLLLTLGGQLFSVYGLGRRPLAPLLWGNAVLAAFGLALTLWKMRSAKRHAHPMTMLGFAFAILLALAMVFQEVQVKDLRGAVERSRSFFGVLAVVEKDRDAPESRALQLEHGRIVHGKQFLAPEKRSLPTTYFGSESGAGLALAHHPGRARGSGGLRIGAVGLGVGTLAAHAGPEDLIRFYELDPAVAALSLRAEPRFSFLRDCPGRVEVVLGDARLSLERELERGTPQGFDILTIDAFSGDAIPVHLLTREAFEVYLLHLARPDGVLAFHVTNGFLDLFPVIRTVAARLGLQSTEILSRGTPPVTSAASWVLVGRKGSLVDSPLIRALADPAREEAAPAVEWTDRTTSLFRILKR